mmetsp:Transcript_5550/g.6706  ORF Transcript_5550/g.6706 Transcript_5550/m.6706 type:complete len:425 (+) Transcript_5550:144-1418(+)
MLERISNFEESFSIGELEVILVEPENSPVLSLLRTKEYSSRVDAIPCLEVRAGKLGDTESKGLYALCFGCNHRIASPGENKSNVFINKQLNGFENGKYALSKLLVSEKCEPFSKPSKPCLLKIPQEHPLNKASGIQFLCLVRGPNMNTMRDDCLQDDYEKGSKRLAEAYDQSFQAIKAAFQETVSTSSESLQRFPRYKKPTGPIPRPKYGWRNALLDYSGKSINKQPRSVIIHLADPGKGILRTLKTELEERVFHRERSSGFVCIYDAYPKSTYHLLVIPTMSSGLAVNSVADLKAKHLPLAQCMHAYAKRIANHLSNSTKNPVKVGYHAIPSMNRLHLHIISQDFLSPSLKTKKHWLSFTHSKLFLAPEVVEKEIEEKGDLKSVLNEAKNLETSRLECNRCKQVQKNMPTLMTHIASCLKTLN